MLYLQFIGRFPQRPAGGLAPPSYEFGKYSFQSYKVQTLSKYSLRLLASLGLFSHTAGQGGGWRGLGSDGRFAGGKG